MVPSAPALWYTPDERSNELRVAREIYRSIVANPITPAPSTARPMSRVNTAALVEAALLLDLVVLLILVRTYLPIPGFQGLIRLVCPAPFILLALRRDVRTCLLATVASYVLLSTLVGPVLAIQILVFGGIGAVFAAVARRGLHPSLAIVIGAALYGVFYLFLPFVLGLAILRVSVKDVVSAVKDEVHTIEHLLARLHLPTHTLTVTTDWLIAHWFWTVVIGIVVYSLANLWAYFVVSRELLRLLPAELRADAQGKPIVFFPLRWER